MGDWSRDSAEHPRESVLNQKDGDGDVQTDTLVLQQPCNRLRVRLTLGGKLTADAAVKFIESQGAPQGTAEIVKALQSGGIKSKSKSP